MSSLVSNCAQGEGDQDLAGIRIGGNGGNNTEKCKYSDAKRQVGRSRNQSEFVGFHTSLINEGKTEDEEPYRVGFFSDGQVTVSLINWIRISLYHKCNVPVRCAHTLRPTFNQNTCMCLCWAKCGKEATL